MDERSSRRRGRAWLRALCVLLTLSLTGASDCTKPGWVTDFEQRMDAAVPRLEQALIDMGESLGPAVDRLDELTRQRVIEFDQALREHVEGLQAMLEAQGEQIDLRLLARVEQLTRAAEDFARDLNRIAQGLQADITGSVDQLLLQTEEAAGAWLGALDLAVARVEQAGDHQVARVYSQTAGVIVQATGGLLLVIGVVFGGIFVNLMVKPRAGADADADEVSSPERAALRKRRNRTRWIPLIGVCVVMILGGILMVSNAVRNWFLTSEVLVVEDPCSAPLARGLQTLSQHESRSPLTGAAVADITGVLPELMACRAMTGVGAHQQRATEQIDRLRGILGADDMCVRDTQCPSGSRCDVYSGRCTARCSVDAHCPAREVCHADFGRCAPLCTRDAACAGGGECDASGRCRRRGPAGRLPGVGVHVLRPAIGWRELARCGSDIACLKDHPKAELLLDLDKLKP